MNEKLNKKDLVSTTCWYILFSEQSLTVSAVLVFGAVDGTICLQLQVVALSAVEFGNDTLKLRFCKENNGLGQFMSLRFKILSSSTSFSGKKIKLYFQSPLEEKKRSKQIKSFRINLMVSEETFGF